MKRLAAVIATALILGLCASAEDAPKEVSDFVTGYNRYADTYAVQPLSLGGWKDMTVYYDLSFGDYSFSVDKSSYQLFASIIIPLDAVGIDFFAVCACMAAAVRGLSPNNYTDLMTVYTLSRITPDGENAKHASKDGYMIMTKRDDIILFGVSN